MLQVNKLKGKITERGLTVAKVAAKIGIVPSTFHRKIAKNTFSLEEVGMIARVLELSHQEAIEIFFAQ